MLTKFTIFPGHLRRDTVPVKSWPRVQYTVEGYASGLLLSIRVRAFGAKGPGPWAKSINARVS